MVSKVLAGALLLGAQSTTAPSGWLRMTEDSVGTVWFVNPGNVTDDAGLSTAWFRHDHSRDRTTAARTSMVRYEVDCANRRYRMLASIRYDAQGRVISSYELPYPEIAPDYRSSAPDTVIDRAVTVICAIVRMRFRD